MSNFKRKFQRESEISQLEAMVRALETFEVRATMMIGAYEALAGPMDEKFMQAVQEGVRGKEYATKAEFYQAVVSVAKSVIAEEEFARATEDLEARQATESPAVPHTPSMLDAAVSGLRLSVSDTSDTSQGGQSEE